MDILKRIWKVLTAVFVIIGGMFIWMELRRRKAIRAATDIKLDRLLTKNVGYISRLNDINKVQKKLNQTDKEQARIIDKLEVKKEGIRAKIYKINGKKKQQRNKIISLNNAINSLESRYKDES